MKNHALAAFAVAASLAISAGLPHAGLAVTTLSHGSIVEFAGPDDLLLNPATAVVAVDVFGDQDRTVNGVLFQTDKTADNQIGQVTTAGGVVVNLSSTHFIDNWAAVQNYTGADPTSAANLAEIMRDIRWSQAPNGLTVDVENLTPGVPYHLQLLFNENGDRDRRWDIAVEDALVVDDMSSEGFGVWSDSNGFAYQGTFRLAPGDTSMNILMQQHIGGQDPLGLDNNPILQAVVIHAIPEPASCLLAALGVCGLAACGRSRRRRR